MVKGKGGRRRKDTVWEDYGGWKTRRHRCTVTRKRATGQRYMKLNVKDARNKRIINSSDRELSNGELSVEYELN